LRLALYYAILGLYEACSGEGDINEEGEVRDITFITRNFITNVMLLKVSDSARSAII
jgi:GDP-D-mannose dehydratase